MQPSALSYYTTLYNAANVPITLHTDFGKNARPFSVAPGQHVTYRGGLRTTGSVVATSKARYSYRYPLADNFSEDYTEFYRGRPNYVHVLRADFKIYRATTDGSVDTRSHSGFPLVPTEQKVSERSSNNAMEIIASGCYNLLSGSLNPYPVAMVSVARDTPSCSR